VKNELNTTALSFSINSSHLYIPRVVKAILSRKHSSGGPQNLASDSITEPLTKHSVVLAQKDTNTNGMEQKKTQLHAAVSRKVQQRSPKLPWRKDSLFTNGARKSGYHHVEDWS
jgi:hypothetical protein